MKTFTDYFGGPPADFGLNDRAADWLLSRIAVFAKRGLSLTDVSPVTLPDGRRWASLTFRSKVRIWTLLASGDLLQLEYAPAIPAGTKQGDWNSLWRFVLETEGL
jgi:hypothetical protein